ncbi:radical SAM family heme chaperone HemW [Candidatus Thioglobus sp.]|nr:radical SAM family heme chaperone HemW [Candidatus Thioglobus sp.]
MLELPPISLYIHYPWCVKKCPYCDFNSHEGDPQADYISALIRDLDCDLKYLQNRQIHSIFIGGGTPSLMSVDDARELFKSLRQKLSIPNNIEITLEANPGTFDVNKFAQFREVGINRLSIGVQSFNNKNLEFLGRIHSSEEAIQAIGEAQKVGFENINIDLMYGLMDQTTELCMEDLSCAIELQPSHISFYQLTLEANTLFAKYPPKLPAEDVIWEMGEKGAVLLNNSGFEQYEISAYGKMPSQHNINYWEFGDYIGIGAGAHGKITDIKDKKIFRTLKPKSPRDYLIKFKDNERESPVKIVDDIVFEFMLNSLRLKNGFNVELFETRTGQPFQVLNSKLDKAIDLDLIQIQKKWIKPTTKGFNFLNELQEIFL